MDFYEAKHGLPVFNEISMEVIAYVVEIAVTAVFAAAEKLLSALESKELEPIIEAAKCLHSATLRCINMYPTRDAFLAVKQGDRNRSAETAIIYRVIEITSELLWRAYCVGGVTSPSLEKTLSRIHGAVLPQRFLSVTDLRAGIELPLALMIQDAINSFRYGPIGDDGPLVQALAVPGCDPLGVATPSDYGRPR